MKNDIKLERPIVVYGGNDRQVRIEFDLIPWYDLEDTLENLD